MIASPNTRASPGVPNTLETKTKMIMKLATWNVNSVRARLPRVLSWLQKNNPDVLCIQETKVEDALFPAADFKNIGYECSIFGQKTYNGVAVLSKSPCSDAQRGFPGDSADAQKRALAVTYNGVRIVNVYVPNGDSVESEKFPYKLDWLQKLESFLKLEMQKKTPLLVCGDFNIAPEDRDVHDPERWRGKVLFHPKEHEALSKIVSLGFTDAFRTKEQAGEFFTWWDYRMGAFHRGWGLRIDFILINRPLVSKLKTVVIDREERKGQQPSDHAPVVAEFEL